jgi:HlyD family secretion protein
VRLVEPAAFTKISALGVEEQRVNVVADLVTPFEQRAGLGDNFRVEARIIVWEAADVLKAPAGALFRQGRQWAAYVIVDGRAQLRQVEAGRSSGTELERGRRGDRVSRRADQRGDAGAADSDLAVSIGGRTTRGKCLPKVVGTPFNT